MADPYRTPAPVPPDHPKPKCPGCGHTKRSTCLGMVVCAFCLRPLGDVR